jgi:hypothetical protein
VLALPELPEWGVSTTSTVNRLIAQLTRTVRRFSQAAVFVYQHKNAVVESQEGDVWVAQLYEVREELKS